MFCVNMSRCCRGPCHVLAWGGILVGRGGGEITRGHWDCPRDRFGHFFCEYGQIYKVKIQVH